MDLEKAIELLKGVVKDTGTNAEKHIDLGLIPADHRELYQKAMVVSALSIKDGKITRDEFFRRVHLDS
jgi:hypothetical protein